VLGFCFPSKRLVYPSIYYNKNDCFKEDIQSPDWYPLFFRIEM
jgi:hypothetical protein